MNLEKNISKYIKSKGINLTVMSKQTGVPYSALYDSLMNENKNRQLRGTELIAVCEFLEKSPMDFMDKREKSVCGDAT